MNVFGQEEGSLANQVLPRVLRDGAVRTIGARRVFGVRSEEEWRNAGGRSVQATA